MRGLRIDDASLLNENLHLSKNCVKLVNNDELVDWLCMNPISTLPWHVANPNELFIRKRDILFIGTIRIIKRAVVF
jgi:hypothetical protein